MGVTTEIKKVDGTITALDDKVEDTNKAIGRNNVRAHALAQDIIDRHGVGQFKKHKVCKTFLGEANNEEEGTRYWMAEGTKKRAYVTEKFVIPPPKKDSDEDSRRRLASMTPSEQVLERRRLTNRPKSHIVVLEALLEEINRLN